MKELIITSELLNKILYKDKTFKSVLRERFVNKTKDAEYRVTCSILLGCELRHHFFISKICENLKVDIDKKCLVYIAISNNLFVKKLNKNGVNAYIQSVLKDDYEFIKDVLNYEGEIKDLVSDVNNESLEYYSYRFNTPISLIKMWQKHYGVNCTFKILKTNLKPAPLTFLSINNNQNIIDINQYFSFDEKNNILKYNNRLPMNKERFYSENNIVPIKTPISLLLDQYKNVELFDVLCFLEEDKNPFYKLFIDHKNCVYNLALTDFKNKYQLLNFVKKYNVDNVNVFLNNNPSSMDACVPNKQDLVIVYPKSTGFEKIRRYPDYLVKFDSDEIDEIISNEIDALNGLSQYVRDNGTLIYMINTMNKKESHNVIIKFLETHRDFILKEEIQYLPLNEDMIAFYYAILEKVNAND